MLPSSLNTKLIIRAFFVVSSGLRRDILPRMLSGGRGKDLCLFFSKTGLHYSSLHANSRPTDDPFVRKVKVEVMHDRCCPNRFPVTVGLSFQGVRQSPSGSFFKIPCSKLNACCCRTISDSQLRSERGRYLPTLLPVAPSLLGGRCRKSEPTTCP